MSGETDLAAMLSSMELKRFPEPVTMVSVDEVPPFGDGVLALIHEDEAVTVVATVVEADERGWPYDFVATWLTVTVHSSLEAVGLTAAMSKVLTEHNIPCNVVAGFFHDHLLVPIDRTDEAVDLIESLSDH